MLVFGCTDGKEVFLEPFLVVHLNNYLVVGLIFCQDVIFGKIFVG